MTSAINDAPHTKTFLPVCTQHIFYTQTAPPGRIKSDRINLLNVKQTPFSSDAEANISRFGFMGEAVKARPSDKSIKKFCFDQNEKNNASRENMLQSVFIFILKKSILHRFWLASRSHCLIYQLWNEVCWKWVLRGPNWLLQFSSGDGNLWTLEYNSTAMLKSWRTD